MALDLSEEQLVNGLIVDGDAVPPAEVRQRRARRRCAYLSIRWGEVNLPTLIFLRLIRCEA